MIGRINMENKTNDRLVSEYLRKCFFSVDGLWFVKTEENSCFEKALEIDIEVWKVLPKIQARTLKKLLNLDDTFKGLQEALDFKLKAEGFKFEINENGIYSFLLSIELCPWVELINNSGRGELVKKISDAICPVEFEIFSKQFDKNIIFERKQKGCEASERCVLLFSKMHTKNR